MYIDVGLIRAILLVAAGADLSAVDINNENAINILSASAQAEDLLAELGVVAVK